VPGEEAEMRRQALWARFALAAAVLLLASFAAGAQPTDPLHACTAPSERQIALCTSVIDARDQNDRVRGLALVMRGNAYRDLRHDLDHAMADYAAALALNPKDLLALSSRGDAYRFTGDFDRAIADYDRLIAQMHADGLGLDDPVSAFVLRNRADACLARGDADRAISDYDATLRILPKDAHALYARGLARQKKGDAAGSAADIAAAKAIRPDIAAELARDGIR
jgi:tetratricopeptide (TPR) repeat protein